MNWNVTEQKQLVEALLSMKTPSEMRRFLRDLLTEKEIKEFSKRFQTAKLLSESVPYSQIEKITGFSSATVARVSRWLNGREGGYKNALHKLHHTPTSVRRGLS